MKNINIIIVILFVAVSFKCKAQQIPVDQYSKVIVGIWVLEEDINQKLEFTADGFCKLYEENDLHTTYQYSFENSNCENYSANADVVYLKWKETGDPNSSCLEVSSMTSNTLSLMIIDSSQVLFYVKQ